MGAGVAGVLAVLGLWTASDAIAAPVCTDPPTAHARTDVGRTVYITYASCGPGLTQYVIKTNPSHGHLDPVPFSFGSARRYVPDPGYRGPDSFTYAVDGAGGESNVVTQAIEVSDDANEPPRCLTPTFGPIVRQGTPKSAPFSCTDDDNDTVTIDPADPGPAFGTLDAVTGGTNAWTLTYSATNPPGTEHITLHASDGHGGVSEWPVPAFDASPATDNRAPTCPSTSAQTSWLQYAGGAYLCVDPDGDPVSLSITAPPSHGVATVVPDGGAGTWIRYEANDGYVGPDSLQFVATDPFGASSAPATFSIDVTDLVPPGSCRSDLPISGVLAEADSNVMVFCGANDAYPISYVVLTPPAHGTLTSSCCAAGLLVYHPDAGYTGPDGFTWRAEGSHGLTSATQTVSFDVVPQTGNTPPSCVGDGPSGPFDMHVDASMTVTFACTNIESGDDNAWVIVSPPTHGTVTTSASDDAHPTFTYTPSSPGVDVFDLKIVDGRGGSTYVLHYQAQVKAADVNAAPVCPPSQTQTAVLGYAGWPQCVDPERDPVTISQVRAPDHGTLTFGPVGRFSYQADTGFTGTDTFELRVADDHGANDVRTFTVNVPAASGGGGGGGGGGATTTSNPSAPTGTPAPSTPSTSAPAPVTPTTAPAERPTIPGLSLGDTRAELPTGSNGGPVDVRGSRPATLALLRCTTDCSIVAKPKFRGTRKVAGTTQRLRVKAGRSGKLVVRVPAAVRHSAPKSGRLRVDVQITVRHADGSTSVDLATFTLRLGH